MQEFDPQPIETRAAMLERLRANKAFICDMDGVLVHGKQLLPGVSEFLAWLRANDKRFVFLTNSSGQTRKELSIRFERMGLDVGPDHFYTSALATASFLATQKPGGSVWVIGDAGLTNALYEAGFTIDDVRPDYVVVGESRQYTYDSVIQAVRLIEGGAKLIGANPDLTDRTAHGGVIPSTGALIAPIELATGKKAYFVGKPNPLMMRHALRALSCRREETAIIGDRMDTDILAGLEAEIETVLVLTGVTRREDLPNWGFKPHHVLEGIGDLLS